VPERGPDVYADWVKSLCDAEDARKVSFESRGVSVITTSGTLVTLLFGLVAVVTGAKNFTLPSEAHGYLIAAVISFVVAVALGIIANIPLFYQEADMTEDELVDAVGQGVITAEAEVMIRQLGLLRNARRVNSAKGVALLAAGIAQLVALVMLAFAVVFILQGDPHAIAR
jgi:hypothetical protein